MDDALPQRLSPRATGYQEEPGVGMDLLFMACVTLGTLASLSLSFLIHLFIQETLSEHLLYAVLSAGTGPSGRQNQHSHWPHGPVWLSVISNLEVMLLNSQGGWEDPIDIT